MSDWPSIDDAEPLSLQLRGQRQDASRARQFLAAQLAGLGWGASVDDACLLVSELVANVALHARTPCKLEIRAVPTELRVDVLDGDPTLPRVRHYDEAATTGRGLRLVSALADGWGADPAVGGKRIWFRFEAGSTRRKRQAGAANLLGAEPDLDVLVAELGGWEDEPSGPAAFAHSRYQT